MKKWDAHTVACNIARHIPATFITVYGADKDKKWSNYIFCLADFEVEEKTWMLMWNFTFPNVFQSVKVLSDTTSPQDSAFSFPEAATVKICSSLSFLRPTASRTYLSLHRPISFPSSPISSALLQPYPLPLSAPLTSICLLYPEAPSAWWFPVTIPPLSLLLISFLFRTMQMARCVLETLSLSAAYSQTRIPGGFVHGKLRFRTHRDSKAESRLCASRGCSVTSKDRPPLTVM